MEDNRIIDALLAEPETGLQLLLTQYGGLIIPSFAVFCPTTRRMPRSAPPMFWWQHGNTQPNLSSKTVCCVPGCA